VYLGMALEAYRLCLMSSAAPTVPVVFRLVSLWFQPLPAYPAFLFSFPGVSASYPL